MSGSVETTIFLGAFSGGLAVSAFVLLLLGLLVIPPLLVSAFFAPGAFELASTTPFPVSPNAGVTFFDWRWHFFLHFSIVIEPELLLLGQNAHDELGKFRLGLVSDFDDLMSVGRLKRVSQAHISDDREPNDSHARMNRNNHFRNR